MGAFGASSTKIGELWSGHERFVVILVRCVARRGVLNRTSFLLVTTIVVWFVYI